MPSLSHFSHFLWFICVPSVQKLCLSYLGQLLELCATFSDHQKSLKSVIFSYFTLNVFLLLTSARVKPGRDHVINYVCQCVCVCVSICSLSHILLDSLASYFLCTSMFKDLLWLQWFTFFFLNLRIIKFWWSIAILTWTALLAFTVLVWWPRKFTDQLHALSVILHDATQPITYLCIAISIVNQVCEWDTHTGERW